MTCHLSNRAINRVSLEKQHNEIPIHTQIRNLSDFFVTDDRYLVFTNSWSDSLHDKRRHKLEEPREELSFDNADSIKSLF